MVPVRVSTGGKQLQLFSLEINFDTDVLEVIKYEAESLVKNMEFKVDAKTIRAAGEVKPRSGIVQLFTLTFKVKSDANPDEGLSGLSGVVISLVDAELDSEGKAQFIGKPAATFTAGSLLFEVADRRRHMRNTEQAHAEQRVADLAPWLAVGSRSRRKDARLAQIPVLLGDANCDGAYNQLDAKRLSDYVLARVQNFGTDLGKQIKRAIEACQAKRIAKGLAADEILFLDPDGDAATELSDLIYLFKVEVGALSFVQARVLPPAGQSSCAQTAG